jgi:fructosamine-3-kinase
LTLPPGATGARRIAGGDINEAYRVTLASGADAFVKTRAQPHPGEYAAEAAALAWLREPGGLPTPRVLDAAEDYLALQWIEPGRLDAAGEEELGRGLARTHLGGAPAFGDPGGLGPARLGSLVLSNEPLASWPEFYAARRLEPLTAAARDRGALSASGARAVASVCERLADLAGPAEAPARLHGDLWSGNVLAAGDGRPWLIDPSAYGGHREIDLAMLALFGPPPERILAAYEEVAPLAAGWRERVALNQLLPLLVHAALFGGGYGAAAERAARTYVG